MCKLRGDWGDPWVLGVADWVDRNTTFPRTKGRKRLGKTVNKFSLRSIEFKLPEKHMSVEAHWAREMNMGNLILMLVSGAMVVNEAMGKAAEREDRISRNQTHIFGVD